MSEIFKVKEGQSPKVLVIFTLEDEELFGFIFLAHAGIQALTHSIGKQHRFLNARIWNIYKAYLQWLNKLLI